MDNKKPPLTPLERSLIIFFYIAYFITMVFIFTYIASKS